MNLKIDRTFLIDFPELRDTFLGLIDRDPNIKTKDRTLIDNVQDWRTDKRSEWVGASIKEMRDYIANGYEPPELEGSFADSWDDTVPRRKLRFTDSGELDVGMALSGADYPFTVWDRRPSKPGLSIHIDLALSCATSANVIAEYGAWVAAVIKRFELRGFDLEVNVSIPVSGLEDYGSSKNDDVLIRLKREDEISDFQQWSPMFSPGGFRMLGFCAMSLAAEYHGFQACSSLGRPMGNAWKLDFDSDLRILRVESPNTGSTFDASGLTNQLTELGL